MEKFKCCICGGEFKGWGNDPWPYTNDEKAKCCSICNMSIVVPLRILMGGRKNESNTNRTSDK